MDHTAPGSMLRSFERHLRAQNRSERTVGNYLENAQRVEVFLEGRGKRLAEATQADLEDFLGDILRRRTPTRPPPGTRSCASCIAGWRRKRSSPTRWRGRSHRSSLSGLWMCCWYSARVVGSERCRSGTRPVRPWSATFASAPVTSMLTLLALDWPERSIDCVRCSDDAAAPRPPGWPAWSASSPVPPYLRAPVAGRGRRRDGSDAPGRLEIARHAAALRRLSRPMPALVRPIVGSPRPIVCNRRQLTSRSVRFGMAGRSRPTSLRDQFRMAQVVSVDASLTARSSRLEVQDGSCPAVTVSPGCPRIGSLHGNLRQR